MNKKKIFTLILSTSITSNLVLSPTSVHAEDTINHEESSILSNEIKTTDNITTDYTFSSNANSEVNYHTVISIPDSNLKKALNDKLGQQPTDDITQIQLESISSLTIVDSGITNLEGLQFCTNIKYLFLGSNQITDISPLQNLTNLTNLKLYSNQISDLNPLKNLTNLTELNLFNNQITDISPLQNLTNLTNLDLDTNQISDLNPLKNLTNLSALNLRNNRINDLQPLSNLTNLSKLVLDYNHIGNISPLQNLTNLTSLSLTVNQITDISPLQNLTNLTSLSLMSNQISDVSPLQNLTNLTILHLADNQIGNISPLQNLINLNTLGISSQDIKLEKINLNSNSTSLELENKITSLTGNIVDSLPYISHNGTYNPENNIIKWEKLYSSKLSLEYRFFEHISIGSAQTQFSGTVTQPIEKIKNSLPTINATDKVLTIGDRFNPLDGVSANDNEDGEITLTKDNIISNNVDMSQAGTYSITYKVTDSHGASSLKTITVVVTPKLEVLNHIPTINATNKVLTVGDSFNPLDGVSANDNEDGEITLTKDNIISNNVDMNQTGTYSITYKVTDSHGASSLKTITVVVEEKTTEEVKPEENKPTIESKPEIEIKPEIELKPNEDNNFQDNIVNQLPQTGVENSLPTLGILSLSLGALLSLKKKK